MKQKRSILHLIFASLFAALITVFTAWLFHIPIQIGANTAYLHFGDAFVFLAASLLPTPYAAAAAAIGGGLADVFCGAAIWAPFTMAIKALLAICFSARGARILTRRNLLAPLPALVLTVGGYYVAEAVLYGNWVTPALSILGNIVQIVGSTFIYILLSLALERFRIKDRIGHF